MQATPLILNLSDLRLFDSCIATIEFTRGIGPDEDMEVIYQNACVDLAYVREMLA